MHSSVRQSRVPESEVTVWLLNLESGLYRLPALNVLLSEDEKARGQTFRSARDRDRYVITHALKRLILGRVLGQQPDALTFGTGPFGKPHLKGGRLHFSLSRSGDHALLAHVWDCRIGVDLEQVRPLPELDLIAAQRFSIASQATLFSAEQHRLVTFFDLWTGHEAVLKATGAGLSHHLSASEDAGTYQNLALMEGYRAAVAVEGSNWFVSTRDHSDVVSCWPSFIFVPPYG
ncbi:4'-phosphopantetheinyl transferase family protein [Deinococcus humi]|uniref:4'-phosphopantetheinyl transferase n=1 Tax=Deinococcus humi TaxID=662880 RepID=A0A7W8NCC7_9DEIO|nr:4'-phosphopantetheinyl transferase superfamily protein [Deinococcus humi]MBB5361186.1 4'-phosphopantetheinyl transferase [Deinococcus humi]